MQPTTTKQASDISSTRTSLNDPPWLPSGSHVTPTDIRQWYGNIQWELDQGHFEATEVQYLEEYYHEAGLLQRWRRPFFDRHFADSVAEAAEFLIPPRSQPTVLDLGCGAGSQGLLFALMGAKVVGADMDETALKIFAKRKTFFEDLTGRALSIELVAGNTFEIDYAKLGPFDGVYSLFAFNMMQPSEKLIDAILDHLSPGARLAILDGNQSSWWCRVIPSFRRDVWTPDHMAAALQERGFTVNQQTGGVALPPFLWTLLPNALATRWDRSLCRNLSYPISCQTLATR